MAVKNELKVLKIDDFCQLHYYKDFYCNTFKDHLKEHEFIEKPHKHDFYLFVVFTHGSGEHIIDSKKHEIKKGSIFLIRPGESHHWSLSKDVDGFILFHTENFYSLNSLYKKKDIFSFLQQNNNQPALLLEEENLQSYVNYFQMIYDEFNSVKHLKYYRICSLIDLLYIELSRSLVEKKVVQNSSSAIYLDTFRRFEQILDRSFRELKFPREYASLLSITTRHLNRICKSLVNKTVSDLILERVCLEAKRLLTHSELSVSEVAEAVGYYEDSYFIKIFKKNEGLTPLKFRKQLLNE